MKYVSMKVASAKRSVVKGATKQRRSSDSAANKSDIRLSTKVASSASVPKRQRSTASTTLGTKSSELHPRFRNIIARSGIQIASDRIQVLEPWIDGEKEKKGKEHTKYTFRLNQTKKEVVFVVGNVTPTYSGCLVAMMHTDPITQKLSFYKVDDRDCPAFTLFSYDEPGRRFGFWLIPKKIMLEKGFFGDVARKGKNAMRFWPPWIAESDMKTPQAKRSQKWQADYFIELSGQRDEHVNQKCDAILSKA